MLRPSLALATTVLFFLCIVLHKLAHEAIAQLSDVPVRGITLFALGGLAQIEREASTPGRILDCHGRTWYELRHCARVLDTGDRSWSAPPARPPPLALCSAGSPVPLTAPRVYSGGGRRFAQPTAADTRACGEKMRQGHGHSNAPHRSSFFDIDTSGR
jgi:hypothetical protein